MRRFTLGTAGHIDHGKTTLVHALTGIDTDRLPEEKRRGITIDIGFARLRLDDTVELDIVDVPGHEAFVRNMLAGATGIDLALLVIAADEGVMPQTREHLAIIRLLNVRALVVALTKVDAAEPDWLELVREDVAGVLEDAGYGGAPLLGVSARTGEGLDALRHALRAAVQRVEPRSAADIVRLPIDRVFTVRGTGTVVTGTLWSGALAVDEQVRIEPAGLTARVRALQRHGEATPLLCASERGAVALAGIDRHALQRGDTLLPLRAPWTPASILTVQLQAMDDCGAPLRSRQRVRVNLGTAEVLARLAVADARIEPGSTGLAQIRLEAPLLARAGDRFIVRAWSPVRTIGGGVVLEPAAPKRKRWPYTTRRALLALQAPTTALGALLELAGAEGVRVEELPIRLPGGAPAAGIVDVALPMQVGDDDVVTAGDVVVLGRHVAELVRGLLRALAAFHGAQPLEPGMEREALRRALEPTPLFDHVLQRLIGSGDLVTRDGLFALPEHLPAPARGQEARLGRLRAYFSSAGLQAATVDEMPPELASLTDLSSMLRHLERTAELVRLPAGRWADASAVASAVLAVRTQLPRDQQLGVAEFRAVLDLSRKHLLPLLEYLDSLGITARHGDVRILVTDGGHAAAGRPGTRPNGPDASASKS
jgi:selenocysteine-specific elongation factor